MKKETMVQEIIKKIRSGQTPEARNNPITLEDLFYQLEIVRQKAIEHFYFSSKGYIEHSDFAGNRCYSQLEWKYGAGLENQDEETIKFFYNIIC